MAPTPLTDDVALLAVLLAVLTLGSLVVHVTAQTVRALQPVRPSLPEEDRAPAGLGRLVPVGAQVEQECRRGLVSLELWLVWHRRRAEGSSPPAPLPRQRDGGRAHRGSAREAG